MLVLTRKVHEKIIIEDNIIIEVLEVLGGRVKLGIQAPRDIPVRRQEVPDPRYVTTRPDSRSSDAS